MNQHTTELPQIYELPSEWDTLMRRNSWFTPDFDPTDILPPLPDYDDEPDTETTQQHTDAVAPGRATADDQVPIDPTNLDELERVLTALQNWTPGQP